jgi:predicted nucleotide-binding protein (sugar kinase/HSP70/actin superfamily)
MKNYLNVYYIGLNDKDSKVQKYSTETFIKMLCGIMKASSIDSFTLSVVTGYYKSESETTLKLELVNNFLTAYTVSEIKELFNQECILNTRIELEHNNEILL